MLDLTSYERIINHLEVKETLDNRRLVLNWISTASQRVQDFLQRDLEIIADRIEYSDVQPNQMAFMVQAFPIISIASVESDQLGLFTTSISQYDYHPSFEGSSIELQFPILEGRRALKYTYTGGLTYHATQSIYVLSSVTNLAVGNYLEGQSSYAVGKIKSINSTSVTVEVLLGKFQSGEDLNSWNSKDLTGAVSGFSGVISSVTRRCLAEEYPTIVTAVEMEIRFMKQHKLDFENVSSGKEGTRRRAGRFESDTSELQPEVERMLYRYKRLTV